MDGERQAPIPRYPCRECRRRIRWPGRLSGGPSMAGESAHFGLRERPPTPAVRPFDPPPRLQAMRDRARAGLNEPFRGITLGASLAPGLFALEQTGVSLAPVLEAARSFLATLTAEQ